MNSFNFTSPGAAFTGQIADLLTQRKMEERQRLLDSLQFSANQRADEAAKREAAESAVRITGEKQRQDLAKNAADWDTLSNIVKFGGEAGDPIDVSGWDPATVKLAESHGVIQKNTPMPTAKVSTEEFYTDPSNGQQIQQGPPDIPTTNGFNTSAPSQPAISSSASAPTTPSYTFMGDNAARQHLKDKVETAQLISSLSAKPETAQAGQLLATMAQANGGIIPNAGETLQNLLATKDVDIFDENSGKIIHTGQKAGPFNVIEKRGYSPFHRQYWNAGVDAENHPVSMDSEGNYHVNKSITIRQPGSANSAVPGNLGVSQGAQEDLERNAPIINQDGTVDRSSLELYRQAGNRFISSITNKTVSPAVKTIARTALSSPSAAAAMMSHTTLSDKDKTDLIELYQQLGIQSYFTALEANKPLDLSQPPKPSGISSWIHWGPRGKQ